MENKIVVVSKDGKPALIGTAFHELVGKCLTTFSTTSIQAFRDFLKKAKDSVIYFNELGISAYPEAMEYGSLPVAICDISDSCFLKNLKNAHGKKFSLEAMEEFLTTLRDYIDLNGKKVLDFCTNANINKIVKMVRTKDNSGNLNFNVKRESGADDFQCPKTIAFKIPILENLSDVQEFTFDMFLGIKEIQDGVVVELNFRNLNFSTQVDDFRKAIVVRELESVYLPKFWGKLQTKDFTDSWKYKEHGIG
jgi:hypothetical protein